MKKLFCILFVLLVAVCVSPAWADFGGEIPGGGRWGFIEDKGELWVNGDSLPDYSFVSYLEGHPMCPEGEELVVVTNAPWAGLVKMIKRLYIQRNVRHIGKHTFRGLYELEVVETPYRDPDDFLYLGDYAFEGCKKLASMDFSKVTSIGGSAFSNTALSYVELPVVKYVGYMAFGGCQNLKRISNGNDDIRPSVYFKTVDKPEIDDYISNIGLGTGDIKFLILAPYAQKAKWEWDLPEDNDTRAQRILFGGNFDTNINGVSSYWYVKGSELIINGAFMHTYSYYGPDKMPWKDEKNNIKTVRIFQTIKLGSYSFANFTALVDVIADSHLTEIGAWAFKGSSVGSVKADQLTDLGKEAFMNCNGLKEISLPKCQNVGKNAFTGCKGLKEVRFGGDIAVLSQESFMNSALKSLTITTCTPPELGQDVFKGLELSSITLHVLAACSSNYAASPWSAMQKDYITSELPISGTDWSLNADGQLLIKTNTVVKDYGAPETVPWHAYRKYVTEVIYLSGANTPKGVGSYMFCDMPKLKSAWFGAEGAKIGQYAFSNCPKLKEVGGMNGLTEIGDGAFSDCPVLNNFMIPATCTKLGQLVFYGCKGMTDLYCNAETPPTVKSNTFSDLDQSKVLLHVPDKAKVTYMNTNYWKNFAFEGNAEHGNIVKTGTFFDGNFILYSDGLLSCTADDGSVNQDATENELYQIRSQVKEIWVHGEIERITNAFKGFTNLIEVTLPYSVTRLVQTFLGCKQLAKITMPRVTYLGVNTFRDCQALTFIDLSHVETIEDNCFDNSGISNFEADNLKSIGKEAFKNCKNLVQVYVGNADIKGENVFEGCTNMNLFAGDCRVLKAGMFKGCSALETVTLYDHVQVIEEDVFAGTALNRVNYVRARPAELDYSGYEDVFSGIPCADITLYVPQACIETFRKAHTWNHMNIQALPNFNESYYGLPQYGFFADPADTWVLNENHVLTIEADGPMSEWQDNFDLTYHPLEQWMPYISTIEVVGETTRTMDNMIPSDRSSAVPGVSKIVLGKNIKHVGKSFDKIYHIEDVYCYAEDVPDLDANAFDWNMVTDNVATLHVSKASGVKEAYKNHNLWKKFFVKADLGEVYTVTLEADYGYIEVEEDVNLNAVPAGTVLHLTAVPLDGSRFVEWENYNPATGLTVNSDVTVRAIFESTMGIESIQPSEDKVQKVLFNGQLLIVKPDGAIYNVQGQQIR